MWTSSESLSWCHSTSARPSLPLTLWFHLTIYTPTLASQGMCTPGSSTTYTTDSNPYLSTTEHRRVSRQSRAFQRDPTWSSLVSPLCKQDDHDYQMSSACCLCISYGDDTPVFDSFKANSSEEQSAALENMQNCIANIENGCHWTGLS